jgi:hypothetical protein
MKGKDYKNYFQSLLAFGCHGEGWVHEQTCHVLNPKGQEYPLSSPFMSATFIARLALFIEKWWIKMLYYDS